MCDDKCWMFDDCCADSNHINNETTKALRYSCEETPEDDNIYMISTCPNEENCANEAPMINIPVTSIDTNITYKNMNCAICNGDNKRVLSWNQTTIEDTLPGPNAPCPENILFQIKLESILPSDLRSRVRYCVPNVIRTCANNSVSCGKHTKYVYTGNAVYKNEECVKCNNIHNSDPTTFYTDGCTNYSANANLECQIDKLLELGKHFHFVDADTAYVYEYHANFSKYDWVTTTNTSIYLCGTVKPFAIPMYFANAFEYTIFRTSSRITILLLLVCLATFVFVNKLRTLHDKILTSVCFTLLCTYVNCELITHISNCFLASISLHYWFLCYSSWSFVAFYDCWYVICCASTKFQSVSRKSNLKPFLVYATIAFTFPMVVVGVTVFLELSSEHLVPCHLKPGYGKQGVCFISNLNIRLWLFCIIAKGEYVLSMVLFAYTLYFVFASKRSGVKSNVPANYYILFVKLALNLCFMYSSFAWMMFMFKDTDRTISCLIHGVIGASRGIFFYFAFAFPWRSVFRLCRESSPAGVGSVSSTNTTTCTEKFNSTSGSVRCGE